MRPRFCPAAIFEFVTGPVVSLAVMLYAALWLVGCGGSAPDKIAAATKNVQAAVEQAQQTAAQATGVSEGSIELTVDGEAKIKKCFARFTAKGATRPAVLQLRSYEDAQSETFPSVLLWATGDAASATELIGQTLEGHLFVQREPAGGVWSSPLQKPISIKVVQVDLLSVTCEIAEAEVERADGDQVVKASGKLIGLWKTKAAPAAGAK